MVGRNLADELLKDLVPPELLRSRREQIPKVYCPEGTKITCQGGHVIGTTLVPVPCGAAPDPYEPFILLEAEQRFRTWRGNPEDLEPVQVNVSMPPDRLWSSWHWQFGRQVDTAELQVLQQSVVQGRCAICDQRWARPIRQRGTNTWHRWKLHWNGGWDGRKKR